MEFLNSLIYKCVIFQKNIEEADTDAVFSFVRDVAEGFMPSYLPIANKRRLLEYGEAERQWQLLRRGRYLEFNLLYDRGVRFGLDGGRIESIMVSGTYSSLLLRNSPRLLYSFKD